MLERIDKVLASQNIGSRKEVKKLIQKGNVKINGIIEKLYDRKIDIEKDNISVNGETIEVSKYMYIMMNKPAGVLSASRDKKAETVINLVPKQFFRKDLFPAGRLDKDTEGLLIITNDGDFAHKMLSPKNKVYKLYEAVIDSKITNDDITAFKNGIVFEDGTKCLPAKLCIKEDLDNPVVTIEICEGKFHQVKKMFAAVSKKVLYLKRVRIGSLDLDNELEKGKCKKLSKEEIKKIFLVK